MATQLSELTLSHLSDFIDRHVGLHFPRKRWIDLERSVMQAAEQFKFNRVEAFIEWLISSPITREQIEMLASCLTVGETYFFRDKKVFDLLETNILPSIIHSRQSHDRMLRIWSAGCASGEEPYSIAMILDKLLPTTADWNITLLATDINPVFLKKANDGEYSEWSFRETPPWIKQRYFTKSKGGRFKIRLFIKQRVVFSYLNLAEDAYPSLLNSTNGMDVIFCRNVLMYFKSERAKKVIQNLHRSLVSGGWLIVSPSEISQQLYSQFATVNFPDGIFYQKSALTRESKEFLVEQLATESSLAIEKTPEFLLEPDTGLQAPASARIADSECDKEKEMESHLFEKALTLYAHGRYEEAVKTGLDFLSKHPEDAKGMSLLARAYANLGQLSEALEWCRNAVKSDKLNPANQYLLSVILQEKGEIREAETVLKRAVYLDPGFILAYVTMGHMALRKGRRMESKKHFENALAVLAGYSESDILPESEGMTAGRLREIIQSSIPKEAVA